MLSKTVNVLLCLLLSAAAARGQSEAHLRYVDEFREVAIREMERAGIPASIKLAQAILESNAGQSELARRANNHFGIKCGNDWDGKTYHKKDDEYDDEGKLVESCFRSYKNPEMSFIAHSEFLRDPGKQYRYGFLFRLDPTDYKGWAEGLRRAGYATGANYSQKLIDIIERYQLFRYDQFTPTDVVAGEDVVTEGEPPAPGQALIFENNDVRYVLAIADETPNEIAVRTGEKLSNILKYNEGLTSRNEKLAEGTVIYIQPKRKSFRGQRKWHYVKEGENMYAISQMYGILLGRLYERNLMPQNAQPAVDERVKIRGCKAKSRPRLASEAPPPTIKEEKPAVAAPDEDENGEVDFDGEVDMPEKEPDEVKAPLPTPPVKDRPPVKPEIPATEEPAPTNPPVTEEKKEPVKPDEGFGEEEEAVPNPPVTLYHTVEKGDTLYNISRRYNTTVEELKRLNGLTSNTINIGQRVRVR